MPTLNSDLRNGRYSRYEACSIRGWLYLRLYETEYALGVGLRRSRSDLCKYILAFELLLDVETGRSQSKHLPFCTGSAFLITLIESDAIEFTIARGPSVLDSSSSFESLELVYNAFAEASFQESSSGSLGLVRTVFEELSFHESSLGTRRSAAICFCVPV